MLLIRLMISVSGSPWLMKPRALSLGGQNYYLRYVDLCLRPPEKAFVRVTRSRRSTSPAARFTSLPTCPMRENNMATRREISSCSFVLGSVTWIRERSACENFPDACSRLGNTLDLGSSLRRIPDECKPFRPSNFLGLSHYIKRRSQTYRRLETPPVREAI
jgi:hypothetical protein